MLDPTRAPKRADLPWLRHRSRPRAAVQQPAAPTGIRYVHERPSAPTRTGGIRYVHERPPKASVDAASTAQPAPVRASLDLDEPAQPTPAESVAAPPPQRPDRRARVPRVEAGRRRILTPDEPTVTLTRLQSGIGVLQVEAAVPDPDLRVGALFELSDGQSSTVQLSAERRFAPAPPRLPVLVARHERFEQLAVDLRRTRELRRLAVYAFAESRRALTWAGTLVVTTFGGGRVELPLESLPSGSTAVLLSLYNVHGEFVLRAEMEVIDGGVREAGRCYGFERISWLDDRVPVD
jgi:hypothetical protein